MHSEFLYREHRKPRWISTLNQKYLFVKHLLDHNLYIEYIFRWQNSGIKSKNQKKWRPTGSRPAGPTPLGRPACPFSSSVGFNLSRGDAPLNSKVKSRELIKVLCTNSIKLSSLQCLRTSKRSSMGGGGVSALCCQWF